MLKLEKVSLKICFNRPIRINENCNHIPALASIEPNKQEIVGKDGKDSELK